MAVLRLCLSLLPAVSLASSSGSVPLASTREACRALLEAAAEKQDDELALMCRARMDHKECSAVLDSLGGRPWSSSALDSTCERHEDLLTRRSLLQQKASKQGYTLRLLDESTSDKAMVQNTTTTKRISYENEFETPKTLNQLGKELPTSNKQINDLDKVIMRNTPAEEPTTEKPSTTAEETTSPKLATTAEEKTTTKPTTTAEEPATTTTSVVHLASIPDNLEGPTPSPSVEAVNSQVDSTQASASSSAGWDDFVGGTTPATDKSSDPSGSDQAESSTQSASSGKTATTGSDDEAESSTKSSSSGSTEATGSSAEAGSSTESSSSGSTKATGSSAEADSSTKSSSAGSTEATGSSAEADSSTKISSSGSTVTTGSSAEADSSTKSSSSGSSAEAESSYTDFASGQAKFERQEGLRQKESARRNAKSRLTSAVVVVSLVAGISAFALRSRWVEDPRSMAPPSSSYSRIDQLAPTTESRTLQLTTALRTNDVESAIE